MSSMKKQWNRSALDRGRGSSAFAARMMPEGDTDISFISSGRSSTDRSSSLFYDRMDSVYPPSLPTSPDRSSIHSLQRFIDFGSSYELSQISQESGRTSCSFSSQSLVMFSYSKTSIRHTSSNFNVLKLTKRYFMWSGKCLSHTSIAILPQICHQIVSKKFEVCVHCLKEYYIFFTQTE